MFSSDRGTVERPAQGCPTLPFQQREGQVLINPEVRSQSHVQRCLKRLSLQSSSGNQ